MENLKLHFTNLYDATENLVKLESKVLRLELYERITNLISKGVSVGIVVLLGCCAITFINFASAFYLGKILESQVLGFLTVGLFYVFVLVMYFLLRKKVARNSVKNVVLLELSKDIQTFDELMLMQEETYSGIELSKQKWRLEFKSLKQELYPNVLNDFDQGVISNSLANASRTVVKGLVNFVLQKTVLRKSGLITKTVVPLIANSIINSKLFNNRSSKGIL